MESLKKGFFGCFGAFLAGVVILIVIGTLFSSGSNNDSSSSSNDEAANEASVTGDKIQTDEKKKSSATECEYGDTTLKYLESKVTKDDLDNDVLVLYFEFTNNSNENKSYMYTYTTKVFQNGVELENNYVHVGEETRNAGLEIQPGTTVRVADSFEFKGDSSTVTVEVEPWVSITDEKLMNFTLDF